MPTLRKAGGGAAWPTSGFNSLFEMPEFQHWLQNVRTFEVSILYLRCPGTRAMEESPAKTRFNSLFEMLKRIWKEFAGG